MKETRFALVDCNNFFVSCERVFRPELEGVPVGVLSNNDGCIIARSNEIKAIGVPMGFPYFKIKDQLNDIKAQIFSANFQLYGDMSWRVAEVLKGFAAHVETYSIDESFLDIADLAPTDLNLWVADVHTAVKQQTGLPVSVGVGATKTLAKLASNRAKKDPDLLKRGGLALEGFNRGASPRAKNITEVVLKTSPVEDVWGIGRRFAPKLHAYGIHSAWDLSQTNDAWVRAQMSVRGLRTAKELRGESCIRIDENSFEDGQKSIAATRTFGSQIVAYHQLEGAVATFAARVAAKLRRKQQLTYEMTVYLGTGMNAPQSHFPRTKVRLPYPTANSGDIITAALKGLEILPAPGIAYKKGGIIAYELVPETAQQMTLLDDGITSPVLDAKQRAMQAVDSINKRYGKRTLVHAVEGLHKQKWHSQRNLTSPAYTTRWSDIPQIMR